MKVEKFKHFRIRSSEQGVFLYCFEYDEEPTLIIHLETIQARYLSHEFEEHSIAAMGLEEDASNRD